MRNLNKSSKKPLEELDSLAKYSHEPKKSFIRDDKETFVSLFNNYDSCCTPICKLETLSPVWTDKDSFKINDEQSVINNEIAYKLYGSERFIQDHWNELYVRNGDENLICPICEIDDAEEMDHYIPRERMPEYSAHIHNLIPLCHKCNHLKGDQWLDGGSRIFFNAYFDKPPQDTIFNINIIINKGVPKIDITTNPKYNGTIIESTIDKLHLLTKYRRNLNKELRSLISETKIRYTSDIDLNEFVEKECKIYEKMIERDSIPYVRRLLYNAVVNSEPYKSWIITRLNDLRKKEDV